MKIYKTAMRSQISVIVPLSVFMVSFFIFKLIYIFTRAQHSYNKIGPITKTLNKESQLALLLSPLQQFFIYFFIVFSIFGFKTNKQKTNKRERKKKKEIKHGNQQPFHLLKREKNKATVRTTSHHFLRKIYTQKICYKLAQ